MISADEKKWNSATTLYIARKIHELAGGKNVSILDMGCGDGSGLEYLLDYGHELYGYELSGPRKEYDLPGLKNDLQRRFGSHFGKDYDKHIRFTESERDIPFDDDSFDIIYANQIFEHVKFFDRILSECNRVLKPDGTLITLFPLATYPIEGHLKIPFAHWIPPGRLRIYYLFPFYALRLRRKWIDKKAIEVAIASDQRLSENTFYRFMNEIAGVASYFFESLEIDTGSYVRAKVDLMATNKSIIKRTLATVISSIQGKLLNYVITHGFSAVFVMRSPK